MVTVVYGALVFCADGFISLWTNQDVVADPAVGPLIGPIMLLVACALVFRSVWRFVRVRRRTSTGVGSLAFLTAAAVYFLSTMTGAALFAIGQGDIFSGVFFLARYLMSPFVLAAAVLAVLTVGLASVVANRPTGP